MLKKSSSWTLNFTYDGSDGQLGISWLKGFDFSGIVHTCNEFIPFVMAGLQTNFQTFGEIRGPPATIVDHDFDGYVGHPKEQIPLGSTSHKRPCSQVRFHKGFKRSDPLVQSLDITYLLPSSPLFARTHFQ
jgi:hypothetical protein